ncbi:integrase_H2C2 domain-containing protein [Trichonephila clavipes]|uniref:Integrase_H2C2 domain-containing protein n=1 Tax=Trichonephila clavipes TaxID=2585209 RepID=A0A8X6V534_TRICX|nr:integrase_H2C2 domain-containing protein [Trichonephila clavipes]
MGRTRLVLGVCGGCQVVSSFSFLHTGFGSITNMISLADIFFSCSVHGISLFSICRNLRDQLNFLLIVNGPQTFDVLPSSTGKSSAHRGWTADLLMCCPAGVPNFLRTRCISYFSGRDTHDRRTLFS